MDRIIEPDELMLEFGKVVPALVLASSSPNRRSLLENAGVKLRVFVPDADETKAGECPEKIVMGIAERKMEAYLGSSQYDSEEIAITADTLVHINNVLLGKPVNEDDARRMLRTLSGKAQTVISASAIKLPGKAPIVISDTAAVLFKDLSESDIEKYISTGEWQGAAGAYRLQKTGYTLIESIDGDWTTVVGLPLKAILETIKRNS